MTKKVFVTLSFFLALATFSASPSLAQGKSAAQGKPGAGAEKDLGRFGDWQAQSFYEQKGKKTCVMWSQPIKSTGKYRKRGDIYMYVTHRSWMKKTNVVSFLAGYNYKKDSDARVLVGGAKFILFTDKDVAWARNSKQDKALVEVMRRGTTMTLDGLSNRSNRTTDIYSLTGFSKAHDVINRACGVK
ncbi:MAG: invasion associated locus B family protein [Proteobacteria bacterium]|nr:invasion associated locus B family protein [Pseudomonadota bacterium]